MPLELKSPDFISGGIIPKQFTCDGADISPALEWNDPPGATKSFALIVDDPDAPGGTWVHWVLFDLPSNARTLAQNVPTYSSSAQIRRTGSYRDEMDSESAQRGVTLGQGRGGRRASPLRVQLCSNDDEPNSLPEYDNSHAVDIEPQMPGDNAEYDERSNNTAVGCNPAAEASVAQCGNGPEQDSEGSSHRVNARESLIDLKDSIDDDLPLLGVRGSIADHMAHNVGDDESADGRGDKQGYACEPVGDDSSEDDPIGSGNPPREAASS